MSFGDQLRIQRDLRGFTQEELAERARMSKGQVSRWERGEDVNPGLISIQRLADALEIHISAFFPHPEGINHGHASVERNRGTGALLDHLAEAADGEVPAQDSWRGDVLKAIAVLNRALRRTDSGAADEPSRKTER